MRLQNLLYLAYAFTVAATSIPVLETRKTKSPSKPKPCAGNSAHKRTKWCDYDINTDYTKIVPHTGVTREYWLSIDEVTVAPDGISRFAMAINGTIPGPTIYANWGDEVVIHVTNHLNESKNGTSIHWHGIRQNYTNQNDGVVSITQCPTAPGSTITYKWRAAQYGSSWYHSHIGLQAWMGVFGGIIINGPASQNYDVDKGMLFLNDWSHQTADELYTHAQTVGPPTLDTGLINGTNMYNTSGKYFTMRANKGESYRLRIVNAAIDTHWKFMIDNHKLTVIGMDLVPVKPYTTDYINIGMGKSVYIFTLVTWKYNTLIRSTIRYNRHRKPAKGKKPLDPRHSPNRLLRKPQRRQHQGYPALSRQGRHALDKPMELHRYLCRRRLKQARPRRSQICLSRRLARHDGRHGRQEHEKSFPVVSE